MSFSFGVKAQTKHALLNLIAENMATVVKQQPEHAHDEATVNATAVAYAGLIEQNDGQDLQASVNGTVGWRNEPDGAKRYTSCSFGISIYSVPRE